MSITADTCIYVFFLSILYPMVSYVTFCGLTECELRKKE